MFRPNYAQDAPPEHIQVGGASYPVNTDYRVWIDVTDMARELYADITGPDDARHNADVLARMQTAAFGGVLADESPAEVLSAIMDFAAGYPSMVGADAPESDSKDESGEVLSFDYDINDIIIAIRNARGEDISYRRKEPFHWWEFLLEVRALCGDHHILKVMEARAYTGTDREARRARRRLRLPHKPTAEEQRQIDALHAAFGD